MIDDERERRRLAQLLGAIVDRIAARHAGRKTQESQITAKIGHALEDAQTAVKEALDAEMAEGLSLPPYDIRITAQDIPERGPGALEKPTGIDLYVNVTVRNDRSRKSKAFVIQAKKGERADDLKGQCRKMLDRSDSAYAWVYGPEGCSVIDAKAVAESRGGRAIRDLPRRTATDVFDAVLACSEGDVTLGLPDDEDGESAALEQVLERLRAARGVSFVMTRPREPGGRTMTIRGGPPRT